MFSTILCGVLDTVYDVFASDCSLQFSLDFMKNITDTTRFFTITSNYLIILSTFHEIFNRFLVNGEYLSLLYLVLGLFPSYNCTSRLVYFIN